MSHYIWLKALWFCFVSIFLVSHWNHCTPRGKLKICVPCTLFKIKILHSIVHSMHLEKKPKRGKRAKLNISQDLFANLNGSQYDRVPSSFSPLLVWKWWALMVEASGTQSACVSTSCGGPERTQCLLVPLSEVSTRVPGESCALNVQCCVYTGKHTWGAES